MKLNRFHKQSGASLMEVLIAMSISLVVTASMIAMMSNSLGSTARIIKMTKLQDDMRVAMQMMSRDVRRSSYNAGAQLCYANDDCGSDSSELNGTSMRLAGDIQIPSDTCFYFETDRNHDGDSRADELGGFRQVVKANQNGNDVGVLQMWTGAAGETPDCDVDAGWVDITNPDNMNIAIFNVHDLLSYNQLIRRIDNDDGSFAETWQRIRKIRMDIQGQLVLDPSIQRQISDVIDVRNDFLYKENG